MEVKSVVLAANETQAVKVRFTPHNFGTFSPTMHIW